MVAVLGWVIKQIMHFVILPETAVQLSVHKSENVVAVFLWNGDSDG